MSETTEEFAARVMDTIDSASLAILFSIGHQTGLLDAMAQLPPSTSSQIADAAGLNERYVREWLGGMTTGQVVEYDPAAAQYSLPRERTNLLLHRADLERCHCTSRETLSERAACVSAPAHAIHSLPASSSSILAAGT